MARVPQFLKPFNGSGLAKSSRLHTDSRATRRSRMIDRRPTTRISSPSADVLLVGSNTRRVARLGIALGKYGFGVAPVVCNSASVAARIPSIAPSVMVVDAPPPVTERHIDLIYHLRRKWEQVPLIAVTASDDPSVLTGLLAIGVDEFSPYDSRPADLIVRLRRLIERAGLGIPEMTSTAVGAGGEVVRQVMGANGRRVALTTREFALYRCLARRVNLPVSRESIIRAVWGDGARGDAFVASGGVYVFHLRRKLARVGLPNAVRTIRGTGYMLLESVMPR